MNIQFRLAESDFCHKLKTREGYETHISQPHLPISSLPSPAEPLEISHFPIPIHSESANFSPRRIANLWLQLLIIQVQNGNFWNYDDVIKLHQPPPARKIVSNPPNLNARTALDISSDPKPERLDQKSVLSLRHKLQKGFLSRETSPEAADMPQMSQFIAKIESAPNLEASVINETKIHKVFIAICKLDSLLRDEEFSFRSRCQVLVDEFRSLRVASNPAEEADQAAELTTQADPASSRAQANPSEIKPVIPEDADQTPPVCITQLTPEECASIRVLAQQCDPPLDQALVELLCILPRFSSKLEREAYQIGFLSSMYDTAEQLKQGSERRKFGRWGPAIPPYVLQLTAFSEGSYGIALYVDTMKGEGIVFKEYHVEDPQERNPKWEHLIGERKPIEEVMQEWIDGFLNGTLLPGGRGAIWDEGPRSLSYRRMLLREYGWPESFPLQAPEYHEFLCRQHDLLKITFHNNPSQTNSLPRQWMNAVHEWYPTDDSGLDNDDVHRRELLSALNARVKEVLDYHQRRIEDRQYALAADVPMQQNLMQPLSLGSSAHIGDGWKVEVSPEMVLERFEEVFTRSSQRKDDDTQKMREILRKGYERRKLSDQGIYDYDGDDWDEADDDSTSDFDPADEESDDEEEYESDEYIEDLNVDTLKQDMEDDVETVRVELERYQIGSE